MKTFLLTACLGLSLVHCAWKINPSFTPLPDQNEINKKAKAEFLQKPIVKQFTADGFTMDCESSICGEIPDETLQTLISFKGEFKKYQDQMNSIMLVKENYTHYDHGLQEAFLPKDLKAPLLQEFFDVLASIREFAQKLGARVGFPNSVTSKASIYPLLKILEDNFGSLKANVARFKLLELSSVYNRFFPQQGILQLRLRDVRKSFQDLWAYMGLFFQAQDFYGGVQFTLDYEDQESRPALEMILGHRALLEPLLKQLQGRSFRFAKIGCESYADGHGLLWDLMVGSECDIHYFEKVLRDQIRVVELSRAIGLRLEHRYTVIDLKGHDECLNKISSLAETIKNKKTQIEALMVISASDIEQKVSSFKDGKLSLACIQDLAEMETVLTSIP